MKMDSLLNPTKKLIFAEYLLDRDNPDPFLEGARQHLLDASKDILKVLTNLDNQSISSPQIAARVLNKFDNKAPLNFFKFYKKLGEENFSDKECATNALNKVKDFIKWVENYKVK